MLSPGCSRAGSSFDGSKKLMRVVPMVFHPLGPAEADTPIKLVLAGKLYEGRVALVD